MNKYLYICHFSQYFLNTSYTLYWYLCSLITNNHLQNWWGTPTRFFNLKMYFTIYICHVIVSSIKYKDTATVLWVCKKSYT